jgi:hypothetical protein
MNWNPSILLALPLAAALLAHVSPLQAQRPAGSRMIAQPEAIRGQAMVDPLKVEIQSLQAEVKRLKAALESLRYTVNANHQAYAKHRHGVASYGITSAQSICPDTPAIDGTMLVMTTSSGPTKDSADRRSSGHGPVGAGCPFAR